MKHSSFSVPGFCVNASLVVGRCLLLLSLMLLSGCYEEREVRSSWSQLKSDRPAPASSDINASGDANCAILVATFQGPFRQRDARELIARLWSEQHVPDLWTAEIKGNLNVYRGRYMDDANQSAQQDLRQTRMILFDGQRPFASAALVDLRTGQATATGTTGPLDLRKYPGKYTLQIGYYDDEFPDFRSAAEKAVAALRADGNQAYFYHGPNRSLVTIGLFDESDMAVRNGVTGYGPRILQLQQKFPQNLGNGRTLIEKVDGKAVREQPSFLVKIE